MEVDVGIANLATLHNAIFCNFVIDITFNHVESIQMINDITKKVATLKFFEPLQENDDDKSTTIQPTSCYSHPYHIVC
jgi:hypothetical protein